MAWLSEDEITSMGFARTGSNVLVSDRASFYNCKQITIGSNVRIDDFCVISGGAGGITIGNYVHISVFASIIGAGRIAIGNFCAISSRASVYSSNDDYSGQALTNPMVPSDFTNVTHKDVTLGRHVIVGSGSVILPGVTLEDGVAVGALSLVNRDCLAFGIYAGNPAKRVKERKRDLLSLEAKLVQRQN